MKKLNLSLAILIVTLLLPSLWEGLGLGWNGSGLVAQNIAITDDDTYTPSSSAMLDVKSTTKGMLIPRLTTAQRVAIVTPATSLLVFDTSLNGFYYYNGTAWINLSSGSSSGLLWSYSSPNVYLTGASDKVGIGISAPLHKLSVSDNVTLTDGTDGSFIDIQNQNNSTGALSGLRFYNGTTATTYKGGIFYKDALSFGRGDLILANNSTSAAGNVTSSDARLTIKNTGGIEVKATSGAAANASLFHVLNATGDTIFAVYDGGVRVNVYDDPLVKASGSKGGFAVGGFSPAKGTVTNEYLRITPDSIRMYIEEGAANKATGSKGGFAVGGFSPAKATPTDYFNIYGSSTATTLNPSEPRIFWYPLKEALLSGRVLVQSPDSVGTNSFATGYQSKAIGNYSQAMGYSCISRGNYSTAIGKNALANQASSFAFGGGAKAYGTDSYALGSGAEAIGSGSYAFGSVGRDSSGVPTTTPTKATGSYSIAFGQGALASGTSSVSFGINSTASGNLSTAMGFNTQATGKWALAMGKDAEASSERSLAIGPTGWFFSEVPTRATANFATAVGPGAQASGYCAAALGPLSISSGYASVALGTFAQATGDYSVSSQFSTASGNNSVAMGTGEATGNYSVALGDGTLADALGSISIGSNCTATGTYAFATGKTVAQSYNSFVVGRYNLMSGTTTSWVSTEPLFVIGNGTSTSARSNALTVLKNSKTGINVSTPESYLHISTGDGVGMRGIIIDTDADGTDYALRLRSNSSASGLTDSDTKFLLSGDGGITLNGGTKIEKIQHGTYTAGTNSAGGVKTVTITFNSAFSTTPKVNVTVKGGNYNDVFAITTRSVSSTQFQVNITRVDSPYSGGTWGQTLYLDWFAWE
ncbi:MAG: hypothetical protein A2046_10775 [Bacteroidetes bacterium GWA2_30_7]|nr:MAG: hypothetical protein A2046_10775 [Bacteroidetes bacterium GWA2_30_7]